MTEFASPEREAIEIVHRQRAAVAQSPLTSQLMESALNYVFVLNAQRQIVFASRNVEDLLVNRTLDSIVGMRPGEALDCQHAGDMEAGCGTSVSCRECEIAKAILTGLGGREAKTESRLTRILNLAPVATDLRVYAVPFEVGGQNFVMLSVEDNPTHPPRPRARAKHD